MQKINKETEIKELSKIGAQFGFSRTRRHPSTDAHIYGYKNRTSIIDLDRVITDLEIVLEFVRKIGAENKQILFVGNKNEARETVRKYADLISQPFVAERWIGGTFTNFKQIRTRIEKLKEYRSKEEKGDLSIYTKKERGVMAIEAEKLNRFFDSLSVMERLPAAIFIIDIGEEKIAFDEAIYAKIPVISLSSTDCNLKGVDYPIVANDSSRAVIDYVLNKVAEAYREGKAEGVKIAAEAVSKAEEATTPAA